MGILQRSLSIAGRAIKVLGFMLFLFVLGLDMLHLQGLELEKYRV